MPDTFPTDLRLLGFPVRFDWRLDRNMVRPIDPRGNVIEFTIQPQRSASLDGRET